MASKFPSHIGDYVIREHIGRGSFSVVARAIHTPTNCTVAIKTINKESYPDKNFKRELKIMRHLDFPLIVGFYEFMEDEKNYYFVLEDLPNGNLQRTLNIHGPFPEDLCRQYFCQLIACLDYLHKELHIVHRDIKLDNMMTDRNGTMKIIDFGLGNNYNDDGILQTACGSPAFAPPEMLTGSEYTKQADIWSCGVVLFLMYFGKLPFDDPNIQRLVFKIINDEPDFPDQQISPMLFDLMVKLLNKDPTKRITLDEIHTHPWFTAYQFANYINENFGVSKGWRNPPKKFVPDEEILHKVAKLGCDKNAVIESLRTLKFDSIGAPYRILKRKKVIKQMSKLKNIPVKPEKALLLDTKELIRQMKEREASTLDECFGNNIADLTKPIVCLTLGASSSSSNTRSQTLHTTAKQIVVSRKRFLGTHQKAIMRKQQAQSFNTPEIEESIDE